MDSKLWYVILMIVFMASIISFVPQEASSEETIIYHDNDEDGRPDEFEVEYGMSTDPSNSNSNNVQWTLMFYVFGDDVPSGNPSGSILPELWEDIEKLSWVGCTYNINIVVQFDGSDVLNGPHQDCFWDKIPNNVERGVIPLPTTTRRFLVGKDASKIWIPTRADIWNNTIVSLWDVTDWPYGDSRAHGINWEANMADPNTLFEFVDWAVDKFPSNHYTLVFCGHGDGVEGFGYDYRPNTNPTTSTKDVLTLSEIKTFSSLCKQESPSINLDLIVFDSCLMGNIEFATEFKDIDNYYVGSENIMEIHGNQYDIIMQNMNRNPTWTTVRVAREFIDQLWTYSRDGMSTPPFNIPDWNQPGIDIGLTYSDLNLNLLTSSFYTQISTMNTALQQGLQTNINWYGPHLARSASIITTDHYPQGSLGKTIDYYYFIDYWATLSNGPQDGVFSVIKNAAQNIKNTLWNANSGSRIIEYERHDQGYFTKTRGIAIYCPESEVDWSIAKAGYIQSTFNGLTDWAHIIEYIQYCWRTYGQYP